MTVGDGTILSTLKDDKIVPSPTVTFSAMRLTSINIDGKI